MRENLPHAEKLEDSYIKPTNEGYYKELLPIKFDMTVNGGYATELVLRGTWIIGIDERTVSVKPDQYSVYRKFLSQQEWNDLSKSLMENLHYVQIPPPPPINGPDRNYLVYNPDRSARIYNPYFAQTSPQKGASGVMLFVRGKGEAPLDDNWVVLGHTYYEVWSDLAKLALYNSIFAPGPDGEPRPFGFFAGAQDEMTGPVRRPMFAPTTRAADILDFAWPKQAK